MRADDPATFGAAFERLRALMRTPEVRAERNEAHETALVEGFIPGREYAVEALLHHGALHVLAIFDKPEPLDGPFFEETIYVTPSSAPAHCPAPRSRSISAAPGRRTRSGFNHGPLHAECRVTLSPSWRAWSLPPRGRGGGAGWGEAEGVFVPGGRGAPVGGSARAPCAFTSQTAIPSSNPNLK